MADNCPSCGLPILQRNERDGEGWVIRPELVKISADGRTVTGKCRKCGNRVDLPFELKGTRRLVLRLPAIDNPESTPAKNS